MDQSGQKYGISQNTTDPNIYGIALYSKYGRSCTNAWSCLVAGKTAL